MMASGSADGSEACSSLVATSFTQSVEPGRGTRSTLMPAFSNQPILVAIAKGAAAEPTVLAHQPTRSVAVCAIADAAVARSPQASTTPQINRCITKLLLLLRLLRWRRRRATYPRTARAAVRG